ncbi:cation:proton antiporter [Acaryochloris sp. IP29b_bin.148]|uniref:cation:proton antiporter n=1 Tax=Acaryochloris sp. IP29b_bin.148 TaxID=2969218 RepID=UPI00262F141F|nr:cation:proton antiporter [Acaryochloris sp. IP29b_bin.148]
MNAEILAAIAVFVLIFGAFSRRLEKSVITPPMAYVTFGLLISPTVLGLAQGLTASNENIKILAEATLAIVLFTDASRVQLNQLRQGYRLPLRLLGIGLPITIMGGTGLALMLFSSVLNPWEAAALATILAPTDAALGQAVVNSHRVPSCIRQAINVESGLNDGICLPVLLLFLALAEESEKATNATYWLTFSGRQIVFGVVMGVVIGYFGTKLIEKSLQRKWMNESFEDLSVLGLSFLAYTGAEMIGGNAFIATFCAGLVSGNVTSEAIQQKLYEFGEAEGQLLTLLTFLLYGAVMIIPSLAQATWQMWLYALGSLTVVRILGVAISMMGAKLQPVSIFFMGWFGPRGIASIVYGLAIVEEDNLLGSNIIFNTMAITVFLSIFVHGLTAYPGANWYGQKMLAQTDNSPISEMDPVAEMHVRLPWRS